METTLLIVDTSTQAGSVALCRGDEILGEVLLNVRSTHSETLLRSLEGLLRDSSLSLTDVDAFGAVVGPGSFTGVRIGVATVQGLALAVKRPVVTATSLETLGQNIPFSPYPVCAMIDARKNEVYSALYPGRSQSAALSEAQVIAPEQLLQSMQGDCLFIGDGARKYRTLIVRQRGDRAHFVCGALNLVRASSALPILLDKLASGETTPLAQLVPCYIRPSDAEISLADRLREASIEG